MKPKGAAEPPCRRCGEPSTITIGSSYDRVHIQERLCGPCGLLWFPVRDKAVTLALERFLDSKRKAA